MSPGVQLMRLGQGDGYWACTNHCNVKNMEPPHWWMIRQIYWVRPESCRSTVGSSPTPPSKSLINVGKNSYRPVLRECPRFGGVPAIALEMHIQGFLMAVRFTNLGRCTNPEYGSIRLPATYSPWVL